MACGASISELLRHGSPSVQRILKFPTLSTPCSCSRMKLNYSLPAALFQSPFSTLSRTKAPMLSLASRLSTANNLHHYRLMSTGGKIQKTDEQELEKKASHHDEADNLYGHTSHHHGNPRSHLYQDGTRDYRDTTEPFHWEDPWGNAPKQHFVTMDGQKMITGKPTRDMIDLFCITQANTPFFPRMRMNIWSNYDFITKCEFLFFWIPTFIIWSLAIPTFSMLYLADEAMYTAMTVKVIGRQWYWIYEVESPTDEE